METQSRLTLTRDVVEHPLADAERELRAAAVAVDEVVKYAESRGFRVHFGRTHQHHIEEFGPLAHPNALPDALMSKVGAMGSAGDAMGQPQTGRASGQDTRQERGPRG